MHPCQQRHLSQIGDHYDNPTHKRLTSTYALGLRAARFRSESRPGLKAPYGQDGHRRREGRRRVFRGRAYVDSVQIGCKKRPIFVGGES